ncbi:general amidase [Calocera viscosa TUFC12733]|uniref:amidase n=1 Tax=Calocera viscosa (strain TUFC12733) TaxID=1330018 RepID=A0A167SFR4_CALVF|nr:general amidase [Calocera viscosa TUFC12733]
MGDFNTESWKTIAARKKAEQIAKLPKEWLITPPAEDVLNVMRHSCGLLSVKELEITGVRDTVVLLEKLAKGEWSAVEVTSAFYKRAIIAHQVTNCLTEIFIDKALAWAASLDKKFKETGKPVGPLHGLPISLKDQICIEGMDTVMGYVSWINKPAKHNAVLVDVLLAAGAVPFVRTNVPQTLMFPETFNVVFGRTTNPYNRSLTPGGSSGGEGALIALGGSVLGVGSDIGGSVRIPAGMCGIYGLRPSYNRIPYQGAMNSSLGQECISSVLGPLSASLSGLRVFTQAVLDGEPWLYDPVCVRKPWDESEYKLKKHGHGEKMCFGIMWDDGVVKPHPPVHRALKMAKAALLAAGHTVIDWVPPVSHSVLRAPAMEIFYADGGENFYDDCAPTGEPLLKSMAPDAPPAEQLDMPFGAKPMNKGGTVPEPLKPLSAYELWKVQWKLRDLRKQYLDGWMATKEKTGTGRPIDGLVTPVAPYAAPPLGKYTYSYYTSFCNTLDYPASTFPVTFVDPALDAPQPPHTFRYPEDEIAYNLYTSPDVYKDAPVNLQLVGQKLEDEAVIGMTEVVVTALQAHKGSS